MQLWGGRFKEGPDQLAAKLNASIGIDWKMVYEDLDGSMAWANALGEAGVLSLEEVGEICRGLKAVRQEIQSDEFKIMPSDEDVHTAVERRLTELIGAVGGKLHTGRSRNDQVVTDFRLWILKALDRLVEELQLVQKALVHRAEKDMGLILPGYTHFQRAQPILLSHWWLSHFWPLQRDIERVRQARVRAAMLPLGSGALAGTSYPVDRGLLATWLGFEGYTQNSLDGVSDRDFVAEYLFCASLAAIHISRMAEALILYSTTEYGFIEIADAYSTGSSLMPQKKNADMLELARGKGGVMIGKLTGFLSVLKGLPSAYDKDLQEDKQPVFEADELLSVVLQVTAGVLETLTPKVEKLAASQDPNLMATDIADYLVKKGIPFRQAHHLVGQVVRAAQDQGVKLDTLPLETYQGISEKFQEDVFKIFNGLESCALHDVPGGTAPGRVEEQLEKAKALLGSIL